MSIPCSIGLLPNKPPTDVGSLIEKADLDGHDFVVVPIANPSFRRVLNENNEMSPEEHAVWKDRPVFDRKDLILNSAGKHDFTKISLVCFNFLYRMVW